MSERGDILLLTDTRIEDQLTRCTGKRSFVSCQDPYDALLEMSHQRWSTVVLTAPRPNFAGLCRASRRLQVDSRLFAICPPSAEPDVRPLAGKVLDDYFIHPPTPSQWRRIVGEDSGPTIEKRPQREGTSNLEAKEFAEMVSAARRVVDLESHIATTVAQRLGAKVSWVDASQSPPDRRPLLLSSGKAPRVLVGEVPLDALDEATQGYLSALQESLPALIATARRTESLHRLAITDHLTRAYNRRYFYHMTDQILGRTEAKPSRVSLLLFDIDDFKRYNDTYGHAAGDDILREVAGLIRRTTRGQDIVARIGGDEFAVLFWDLTEPRHPDSQPPETAQIMAERFREALGQHEFQALGPEGSGALSISGGLATYPDDGEDCRQLLRSADQAMKHVKRSGKNAIRLIGG